MVTVRDLEAISGRKGNDNTTAIAAALNKHAARYGVTNQRRLAEFLANVSHETGGFRILEENLNYSATRLRQVWPSRFTAALAKQVAGRPRDIAEIVYGDRMGNSGKPSAGWLYRGSGPGQTTGYDNFLVAERATGIPFTTNPDLMRKAEEGMIAALCLWQKWGLNARADAEQTTVIRQRWNGGTNGLAEVRAARARAMKVALSVPGTAEPLLEIAPGPMADGVLRRGESGDEVAALIRDLVELGYYDGVLDNIFGAMTEEAVKDFQQDHRLTADGKAGPATLAAIKAALAARDTHDAATAPSPAKPAETAPQATAGGWLAGVLVALAEIIKSWRVKS